MTSPKYIGIATTTGTGIVIGTATIGDGVLIAPTGLGVLAPTGDGAGVGVPIGAGVGGGDKSDWRCRGGACCRGHIDLARVPAPSDPDATIGKGDPRRVLQ